MPTQRANRRSATPALEWPPSGSLPATSGCSARPAERSLQAKRRHWLANRQAARSGPQVSVNARASGRSNCTACAGAMRYERRRIGRSNAMLPAGGTVWQVT